jgi:hypothetical protein
MIYRLAIRFALLQQLLKIFINTQKPKNPSDKDLTDEWKERMERKRGVEEAEETMAWTRESQKHTKLGGESGEKRAQKRLSENYFLASAEGGKKQHIKH